MDKKVNEELQSLVSKATAGDKKALEKLISGIQDMVFNLSLRMLGTFADAEDATQDILLKVITHLSSFRGDSLFTTWVFSIAVNYLKNYKKHMFAQYPLRGYRKREDTGYSGFNPEYRKRYLSRRIENVLHQCNAAMS